jgi:hypothetical protein
MANLPLVAIGDKIAHPGYRVFLGGLRRKTKKEVAGWRGG